MNTTNDTLDHDSHDGRVEHPTTNTVSVLDRPVAPVDAERPTLEARSRGHWLGWVLVVAALVAAAALAVSLLAGNDGRPSLVGDAKDHVGYGQATPVVAAPLGDAKDHAGYGQATPVVADSVGDAKDHAGYGSSTAD